jgi:hypothetical protein
MKRMLNLGTDAGFGLLEFQQQRFHGAVVHLLDGAAFGGDTAPGIWSILLFVQIAPHAGVARITVYPLVVISDQVARHGDIGDIGRGGGNTVGQSCDRIDTDMGLHAEKPLVALLGLLHFRVTLLGLVLGGGCGGHNGGVDDSALTHEQALLGQVGVDFLEDTLGQGMLLQQMTEAQQRGRIRHALDGQIDTDEVAHGLAVVDGILQRLIGERIPLLQEVDPQHALQANRRPASLACRVRKVGRRQCLDQPLPWHQGIHLCQESLSAGDLLLVLVLSLGERDLLHQSALSAGVGQVIFYLAGGHKAAPAGFMQRFPSSSFVYLPEYSGIAFLHVWNGIQEDVFPRRFKSVIEAAFDGFFVACDVEPVSDYRAFTSRLKKLSHFTEFSATVHPPNPLFGRLWGSLNEYIDSRNASEVTVKEQTSKPKGLKSKIIELMDRIMVSPEYEPDEAPAIGDAAILMAADGYGRGKVVGMEKGDEVVIKTSDTQKSFLHDKEPIPGELAVKTTAQFDKVSKERDMKH